MYKSKKFWLVVVLALVATLLIATPILSQGNCNGNGNGNGRGNGQNCDQPAEQPQEDTAPANNGNGNGRGNNGQTEDVAETAAPVETEATIATEAPAEQSETLLGCQRNNPDRLDCSSLSVGGVCEGGVAVFTITNTGEAGNGDMLAGTSYRLYVDGVLVESGTVQLAGGATMEISWSGGGNVTLEADQQVGHPGSSHPRTSLNCGVVTEVPTEEPTTEAPTEEPTTEVPTEEPELVGDIVCNPDGTATATITNIGGDMTDPVSYVELGMDGSERSSGSVQLARNTSTSITIAGDSTLNVGNGLLVLYVSGCLPPTEPTEPADEPYLIGDVICVEDGSTLFTITNIGGDMTAPVYYYVVDVNGWTESEDTIQLAAGQSVSINGSAGSAMAVDGWFALYSDCGEPPAEQPYLIGDVTCDGVSGTAVYTITNVSTVDMTDYVYWYIIAADGSLENSGYLLLAAGQSTVIYGSAGSALGVDGWFALFAQCEVPTEEPTPTEPPTEEPTVEPTEVPTEPPTEEPTETPTEEPTVEPTPTDEVLGCQKNNPDRLDCSSLDVSGMCVGGVAVFTITNTGEAGNGDMRATTEYRIYVDGVLVETGTVDLDGATSMQISYAGGGQITLEADQQIGHPGSSEPHVTLSCGG